MPLMDRVRRIRLDPFPNLTEAVGQHLSKPRLVILTVVLTKILLDRVYKYAKIVNPNPQLDSGGNETLDILEYYYPQTPEEVYQFLEGYGARGRQAYETLTLYDSGFLVMRTLPLCLLTYYGFKRAPQWIRPGIWIHLLTTMWDLCENLILYVLLELYPRRVTFLARLVAGFIQVKWILFWVSIGLLCISMVFAIYYGFHGLLADSVRLENDRKDRLNARRHVYDVLQRQRAAAASAKKQA